MRRKTILLLIAALLLLGGCGVSNEETANSKNIEDKTGFELTQAETYAEETTEEETASVYETETVSEPETATTKKAETKIAKIITTVTETLKTTTAKQKDASTTHKKAVPKTRNSRITERSAEKATTGAVKPKEPQTEGTTRRETTAPTTAKAPVFIPSGGEATKPKTTTTTTTKPKPTGKKLSFSTKDINGKPVSMSTYSSYKVIIINMWEPWCGPCVGEMPDLQKLYKNYKSKGLLVIGVYSTEEDAKETVESNGITYPIIKKTPDFTEYETGYVPTTIIVDGEGNVLTSEPIVGSRSYKDWEAIVKPYLN